jgi:ketosteroid isomerase-like protein
MTQQEEAAMADTTIAQRFVEAFGGHDMAALAELYDEQVVLYSPLVWEQRGRQPMLEYAEAFLAPFYGHPPTGESGMLVETHVVTIRDGRIAEQWVGDTSFQMPYMDLVQWQMDFPGTLPIPSR